jgi:Flp pilus assembly pilin Flp
MKVRLSPPSGGPRQKAFVNFPSEEEMRNYQQVRLIRAKAQALAEYALILALIAILCIVVLKFLGGAIGNSLSKTGSAMGG